MPYDDYQSAQHPTFLLGPYGRAWSDAFGLVKDAWIEALCQGIKCRWVTVCPIDALQNIGSERGIPRLPTEDWNQYRTRLTQAWVTWTYAGTVKGVTTAVQQLGYTSVTIKENAAWPSNPSGSPSTDWARFTVIIGQPNTLTPASTQAIANIKAAIAAWKPPHAKLLQVIVVTSGALIGNFTCGDGTVCGGTSFVA